MYSSTHYTLCQYFFTQMFMKSNITSPDKHKYLQIINSIDENISKLFYIGTLPADRPPSVAIVGSRKPTAYGKTVAYRLSNELAAHGAVIVSGLALGIDGIAHQGALDAGGTTVAVLAGGLDDIYPARHQHLAEEIIQQGGALISEYPEGMPPMGHQFLERNRIVSGLSDVVIVVEAASRSGTLSTARWAIEQGKTLMAVPGNITSPTSAGCNQLLKSGALPVTDTKDVLQELGLLTQAKGKRTAAASSPQEKAILDLLQTGLRDGDQLHQNSGLSAAEFQQTLTMMEITGKIRALGANQWAVD